ncbi:type II toxin-antitoxin system HicB family antitoxin [Anaerovorax odorimutans]|uniref:type II toxin-antitoxin system HicB family antitoxin n=1 Tax=Anaerovorax odorimutans TaxID=109327 RepID=UPI00040BAD23|nr:type II toxin-antitoxin system HicB family antitoxin [Anaerovorax odorimutans]
MKKVYPVIFTQIEDCILVEVPDLEILTQGEDFANAIEMARDAIGLKGISLEDDNMKIPESSINIDIKKGTFAKEGKSIISLVDIDFGVYRRRNDNKMVRRNVTLPNWLNQRAEEANVNVSRILQDALMEKLEIQRER